MAGVPYSATFSFAGISATVVGLSVETPTAEVVDMTPHNAPAGQNVLVPTGHWTGGSISVDFLYTGSVDPQTLVRRSGQLIFRSTAYSVTRQVVLESASVEARVGEVVRGTLRFLMTDYTG